MGLAAGDGWAERGGRCFGTACACDVLQPTVWRILTSVARPLPCSMKKEAEEKKLPPIYR